MRTCPLCGLDCHFVGDLPRTKPPEGQGWCCCYLDAIPPCPHGAAANDDCSRCDGQFEVEENAPQEAPRQFSLNGGW